MKNIKTAILNRVIEDVKTQIQNAEIGRLNAIEESKAHKGAMASRYDTFKEEAQYLAGGYSARLFELGKALDALMSIRNYPPTIAKSSCYAIIEVENLDDGLRAKYFLLPAGGGNTYEAEGEKITALNMDAPLARAFIGTVAGDEVEVRIRKTMRRFGVVSVT